MRRKCANKDTRSNEPLWRRVASVFYQTSYYYGTSYVPTTRALVIAYLLVLVGCVGFAYIALKALAAVDGGIDMESVLWLDPILGTWWLDAIPLAIGAFVLCTGPFSQDFKTISFIEKTRWAIDREKKLRDERRLYDVYKKIYQTLDKTVKFRVEHLSAGAWDEMKMQLRDVYDALSMHAMRVDLPSKIEVKSLSGENGFDVLIDQAKAFHNEISDLVTMWSSKYGLNGLAVCYAPMVDDDKMDHIARALGMDSLIEAYYAGVPVDDILA